MAEQAKPSEELRPVYVNSQQTPVDVFDEQKRRITVMPFAWRGRHENALFAVEGQHYKQFLHPHGPLTFLQPTLYGQEVYDKVLADLDELHRAQDRARELAEHQRPGTKASDFDATRPPARIGLRVPVVLDVATTTQIGNLFGDATNAEKEDIGHFVASYREDDSTQLPPHLARFADRLNIVVNTDPASGPQDDPLHPDNLNKPDVVGQNTDAQRRRALRGQQVATRGSGDRAAFPIKDGETPAVAVRDTPPDANAANDPASTGGKKK